jgi:hypothetical protein
MKPESAKKIIDAYLDVFEQLSLRTFNQGLSFVVDSFEERFKTLKKVRTREGLQAMLLKEPEPDEFVLEAQIESIRLLPYTLREVMPEAMHDFAMALPHDPGGRPVSLNLEERRRVCEEIGKLVAKGVLLLDAQNRMSHRMGVSVRTIQRAWQDRAKWFEEGTRKLETSNP